MGRTRTKCYTVLHINKFHYMRGGCESVYFRTADILERHGHRSVFFSMHYPENLPCETSEYFMPYIDLNYSNGFVNKLKTAGRLFYSFEAKKRLSELLDKYSVNIAHLHNINHQISPSILHELKKKKIPVVMTLHDYKMVCASYSMLVNGNPCEDCHKGKYFMAIKNRCVKNSVLKSTVCALEMYLHHKVLDIYNVVDVFISPSLYLKNKLKEMGIKKKMVHLPNFIDIQRLGEFKAETSDGKTKKENSIVYFGRLSSEKGLWTLLETAKLLTRKNANRGIEIKIIGDGPIKDRLREKAGAEGIDNIRFLGHMRDESLYREIQKSIAAVIPSEWYENNPMSVIEVFALGIPVIGSRIGGIPELVKDNEMGLTFHPGNSEDLSAKIEYLANNPDETAEMGEKARVYVEQELNAEKYYEKLMEIYKQVITKKEEMKTPHRRDGGVSLGKNYYFKNPPSSHSTPISTNR